MPRALTYRQRFCVVLALLTAFQLRPRVCGQINLALGSDRYCSSGRFSYPTASAHPVPVMICCSTVERNAVADCETEKQKRIAK